MTIKCVLIGSLLLESENFYTDTSDRLLTSDGQALVGRQLVNKTWCQNNATKISYFFCEQIVAPIPDIKSPAKNFGLFLVGLIQGAVLPTRFI